MLRGQPIRCEETTEDEHEQDQADPLQLACRHQHDMDSFPECPWAELSGQAGAALRTALRSVAERHGRPMAQIAYAWVASRPGITSPIVGISKAAQFDDALAALTVTLSDEDVAALEAPYQPKPIAEHA